MGITLGRPQNQQSQEMSNRGDRNQYASVSIVVRMPLVPNARKDVNYNMQVQISTHIDRILQKEKDENLSRVKILLLGGADAGKSTIVKQMRILHMNGFDAIEMRSFQTHLRSNLLQIFHEIALGVIRSNMHVADAEKVAINRFTEDLSCLNRMDEEKQLAYLKQFRKLKCVRQFLTINVDCSSLPDNAHYFLPNLSSLLTADYVLSADDILHLRVPTTAVNEINFSFGKSTIRLIDVGGQRTYRKKWIHCFDGCAAVLFVASMAAYDQALDPVDSTVQPVQYDTLLSACSEQSQKTGTRLRDSALVFAEMLRSKFLRTAAFILFLNKNDLFLKKLASRPLGKYIPEYNGVTDEAAKECIKAYFLKRKSKNDNRMIYSHYTCATDTNNVEFVFKAACDIAINQNLSSSGLQ